MKKTILSFSLIFTILFNTYSLKPAYADPVTIGVTSYEVYTYVTLVLTYLGVEFKNAQERQRWIEDEYGTYTGNPDGGFYDIIDYQIRRAKADAKLGGGSNKPEPRQIAIPVPDNIIDSLYNKLKGLVSDDVEVTPLLETLYTACYSHQSLARNFVVINERVSSTSQVMTAYYLFYPDSFWEQIDKKINAYVLENGVKKTKGYGCTYIKYSDSGVIEKVYSYNTSGLKDLNSVQIIYDDSVTSDYVITLPYGDFIKDWISPYTGMRTVTMPLTTTGIESPVEVPVIPGDYEEPAPEEVPNPIPQPEDDPLINPETGLPFIGPDGLPIFPTGPLVPAVPVTPIPQPQPLQPGQTFDYRPNLTEIDNDIKQLPEKILNPIKKLFIPDKISTIDFSPLNVPLTKKFPFCIPWDLRDAVVAFSAPPVPPVFTFSLTFFGDDYPIVWDFAIFDEFAEITRFFVLIGFVVGLILATRGLIKG